MLSTGKHLEMDQEWIKLMKEAKLMGLTIEEVRLILKKESRLRKS